MNLDPNKIQHMVQRIGRYLLLSAYYSIGMGMLIPHSIGATSSSAVETQKTSTAIQWVRRYLKEGQSHLAMYVLFEYLKKNESQMERLLPLVESVVSKTGTLPLYMYDLGFLMKMKAPSIAIHVAQYYFKMKDYQKSLDWTNYVSSDSSYYPEALLVRASIFTLQKDARSLATYDQCSKVADRYIRLMGNEKLRRYFVMIKEDCLINKGRQFYEEGDFSKALDQYELIDKVSYSWPFVLMDKGWSYYKKRDYNRSLGIMMTYQSPLLRSYFFPEAEVLQALSYFQLCLYKDANSVIDKYYKVYAPKANSLKEILKRNAGSDSYFFDLVYKDKSEIDKHPYLYNLRNQLRKQIKINIHLFSYYQLNQELESIGKSAKNARKIKVLNDMESQMQKIVARHVREYITYFINSINYYSFEMFNIKLEMISRKKDLLYENKRFLASRARGSLNNVQREEDEFFYPFKQEFWADELGDYAFGLESNCKTIKAGEKI